MAAAQRAAAAFHKAIGTVRIGVAQLNATGNPIVNYAAVADLCGEAEKRGCRLLCLPECFHFIGSNTDETFSNAEHITEGPSISKYQSLARQHKLWLSLGGFHEVASCGDNGQCNKVFNTHLVLDNQGEIVASYRKIHLFDVDIPGGAVLQESKSTSPGHECMVVPTPFGTLGLSTCYDLRFPELYTELAARGADILLIPSAFTVPTGRIVVVFKRTLHSSDACVIYSGCHGNWETHVKHIYSFHPKTCAFSRLSFLAKVSCNMHDDSCAGLLVSAQVRIGIF
eukprot:m.1074168 g.1074168  ORF g.1074168 m.1074168 type:complete len:283 (+) comp24237_c0_seq33:269-1117(+)